MAVQSPHVGDAQTNCIGTSVGLAKGLTAAGVGIASTAIIGLY
ncbi:MAG: hypothetical protein WBF73_23935 [Bradyrhizobium sp.]|jgi:hypothetical protein